jgi:hypothetical protein
VARAKDFERAAKQDLEQYRTWLEHYTAADQKDRRKHERRLKREQARYRRRLRYRYARRLAYRYGSATLRFIRATALSCWKAIVLFSVLLLLLAAAIGKWVAVKVQVFALLLVESLRSAVAWTKPRAYRLAVRSRRQVAHAAAWTSEQVSHAVAWSGTKSARALIFAGETGSQAATWTAAKGTQAVAFTGAQLKSGARETAHATAVGSAWLSAKAQACVRAVPPMMRATRRETLRARRFTRVGALRLRDGAVLRLAALRELARRAVSVGKREEQTPQPAIALLTFQPASGALVPIKTACTALTVFEPAPWTGAAQRGISITAPEPDAAQEPHGPKRKRHAVKARPRKPRRGPRRKRHQSPAAPGKSRPRGRKRPRVS